MAGFDFGSVLSGAGVGFQQQALGAFGAVVDQYTSQSAASMFGNYNGLGGFETGGEANPYIYGQWNGTNYAEDLIKYQPKHRFMFRVLFEVDPLFAGMLGREGRKDVFQYVIKKIARPTINFEYEPVNYYNFKTQVLKTIHFDPIDITMIDDIQDTFHSFAKFYLEAHSPLARSANDSQSIQQLESGGFNFSDAPKSEFDSAIRGVLPHNKINPLKAIKIIQYFGHASAQNTFVFVNPKITSISYDDAHHENDSEGSHASVKFEYDGLYIEAPDQAMGRSPYAVPGKDMYGNIQNDYISTGNTFMDDSLANGLGMFSNGMTGVLGGIAQSATSQMLGGITNPILGQAIRNVSSNAIFGMRNTAQTTLFGALGGGPNYNTVNSQGPGFVNGIIME